MEKYANETLDTGLFPTLCPHGCFVESEDEVCLHGCKSITRITWGDDAPDCTRVLAATSYEDCFGCRDSKDCKRHNMLMGDTDASQTKS